MEDRPAARLRDVLKMETKRPVSPGAEALRLYYSMMRDKNKELAIEGGAKFEDTSDAAGNDTRIELQRICISLTRDDLPALRAAIAELEKEQ